MANLKDIAKASGFSIRTVNRVLKENGSCKPESRDKILRIAQDLGYRPNLAARMLKTGKSLHISVLIRDMHELHVDKISALERYFRKEGYTVQIFFGMNLSSKHLAEMHTALESQPAGLIIFPGFGEFSEIKSVLEKHHIPFVMIDFDAEGCSRICIDRQQGVYESIQYFIKQGKKKILYLGRTGNAGRIEGYQKAMKEANLEMQVLRIPDELQEYDAGVAGARKILEMKERPQAIQAFSDYVAMGLLAGLHENGVRIPEDISIIGFDDREVAELAYPKLTTVAQPSERIGEAAAELLLKQIRDKNCEVNQKIILPTQLIIRQST